MFTCIYSHSKDDLPSEYKVGDTSRPSWWNDPIRREMVAERIADRDARRKKLHEQNELAKQRNSKKSKKKKKKSNDPNANTNTHPESSSSHSNGDETLIFEWESDSEGEVAIEEEFEGAELGLLSLEDKPWENEETKVRVCLAIVDQYFHLIPPSNRLSWSLWILDFLMPFCFISCIAFSGNGRVYL